MASMSETIADGWTTINCGRGRRRTNAIPGLPAAPAGQSPRGGEQDKPEDRVRGSEKHAASAAMWNAVIN